MTESLKCKICTVSNKCLATKGNTEGHWLKCLPNAHNKQIRLSSMHYHQKSLPTTVMKSTIFSPKTMPTLIPEIKNDKNIKTMAGKGIYNI